MTLLVVVLIVVFFVAFIAGVGCLEHWRQLREADRRARARRTR